MTISLDHIVPYPLKEKINAGAGEIWNKLVHLKANDFVKIIAPSGKGKTTLIHVIWNLRNDYSGRVLYDERPINTLSGEEMAHYRQEKISVIFQDLRLFPQLTAFENIELKRIMPAKPYYDQNKIKDLAERLGITHILQQPAGICSYGEQQRIAIIRSLIQPFSFLVMDEPFSHLDDDNTRLAATLIREECQKRNAGFLLTDLDPDDLFPYSKSLYL